MAILWLWAMVGLVFLNRLMMNLAIRCVALVLSWVSVLVISVCLWATVRRTETLMTVVIVIRSVVMLIGRWVMNPCVWQVTELGVVLSGLCWN